MANFAELSRQTNFQQSTFELSTQKCISKKVQTSDSGGPSRVVEAIKAIAIGMSTFELNVRRSLSQKIQILRSHCPPRAEVIKAVGVTALIMLVAGSMSYYRDRRIEHMNLLSEARGIDLQAFQAMPYPKQQELIIRFNLQNRITPQFFEKLNKASPELLEWSNLAQVSENHPSVKYLLMDDQHFNQLTLNELTDINQCEAAIKYRVHRAKKKGIPSPAIDNPHRLSIGQFYNLNGTQINQYAKFIPPHMFSALFSHQSRGLDLQRVPPEQLNPLMEDALISSFSAEQLNPFISKLDDRNLRQLQLLKPDQFRRLDFSKLSGHQMKIVFSSKRSLIKFLSPQVPEFVLNQLIFYITLMTDEQRNSLNMSLLTKSQVETLFHRLPTFKPVKDYEEIEGYEEMQRYAETFYRQKTLEILSLLSPRQITDIMDKLSQENRELAKVELEKRKTAK